MKDWFFHQERGKTLGPITVDEVKIRIREGRIRLTDLIFKDGEPGWRMALEYPDLRAEFKSSAIQTLKERPWVCLQRKSEASHEFVTQGPYSEEELKTAIMAGKVSYGDYVWREGFTEWRRIGSLPEFNRRAASRQPPSETPPLPEIPREEILKNVVEFRRPRIPEPEPPPPEAIEFEDLERTVIHPRTVSVSVADPVPVPVPESDADSGTGSDSPVSAKRRVFVDWGIVAGLAMLLLAGIFAVSNYIRTPPSESAQEAATEAGAPIPEPERHAEQTAPAGSTGGVPVTEDPPKETTAAKTKPPPTQLDLAVHTVSSNQVRIELRTDATPEYPVYIQIVGLPGQVTDGASYYRYLKFIPTGDGSTPLDLSGLKLPQGKFYLRVSTGDLRKEARMSVGVNEVQYKNTVARLRKQHAHLIWKERLQLFKLASDLEKEITEALGGKRFRSRGFRPLNGVRRSNGAKYVMFDNWYELKEILEAAQTGPTQAILERAKKARTTLSTFTVWK